MPNYHLYDEWINEQIASGKKRNDFKYYLDYSIGFTSRGCFRQCEFCVNRNYKKVDCHSPLSELNKQIDEAISKGRFSISNGGTLQSVTRERLESLGYKIQTGSQYNESYYSISWS